MNIVHEMDKKYSGAGAIACPNDPTHGSLGVHGSGAYLVCGLCNHRQPTNVIKEDI